MRRVFYAVFITAIFTIFSGCATTCRGAGINPDDVWNDARLVASLRSELEQSQRHASELGELNRSAYELARQSNERLIELAGLLAGSGGSIDVVIERQRSINSLALQLIEDNRQLRKLLDIGVDIRRTSRGADASP